MFKDRDQERLINKIHDKYVKSAKADKNNPNFKKFIENLLTAFGKNNHTIHLISILT